MKLYANPAAPRPQAFYLDVPTPASAYSLQQRLLRAYREVLFQWWDLDQAITMCFGPKQGKRLAAAEDRLQYEVPELLERMSPEELSLAATVFYHQTLVGFVWHVLAQERTVQHRMSEGNCKTRLDDDRHAIAAGLGKGAPMRRPSKASQTVEQPASCLPAVPTHQLVGTLTPAPSPIQTPEQLRLRVNRAQERRRLKRKRR
jgi:hypothetical protein